MRSFLWAPALAALAAAAPRPQELDFDLIDSIPDPSYTEVIGASAQTVSYNPTTVYAAAVTQITATFTDISAAVSTTPNAASNKKRAACAAQPAGAGPVTSPDTASDFVYNPQYSSAAMQAYPPKGYSQAFQNQKAASKAYGYLGFITLQSYDVGACAANCTAMNGCVAINIFFERDPSVDPGTGDSGCANPPSTTNIKCAFWGGPVTLSNAVNTGPLLNQFQVAIAGSNGYTSNAVASVPGYGPATALGNMSINAPVDQYGFSSYMGSAMFVGAFDANLCAKACTQKSNYALAHPPSDGSPVQTCQFFNTYIIYINTTDNVQGQYCAMYSQTWNSSYAISGSQTRGNNRYMMEYSFTYSNATNPGSPNPLAAVYQAKKDVLWPANSATGYCSTLLGYTTPVTTVYSTATVTPSPTFSITTTTTTVTTNAVSKRQDNAEDILLARAAATSNPKPAVLSKYPSNIISSACSLAVSPVSVASTTQATTTVTLPAATSFSTSVVTTTTFTTSTPTAAPTFSIYSPQGNNVYNYIELEDSHQNTGSGDGFLVTVSSDASQGSTFTLDPTTGAITVVNGPGGSPGQPLVVYDFGSGGAVLSIPASDYAHLGFTLLSCAIGPFSSLQCQFEGGLADLLSCPNAERTGYQLGLIQSGTTNSHDCTVIYLNIQKTTSVVTSTTLTSAAAGPGPTFSLYTPNGDEPTYVGFYKDTDDLGHGHDYIAFAAAGTNPSEKFTFDAETGALTVVSSPWGNAGQVIAFTPDGSPVPIISMSPLDLGQIGTAQLMCHIDSSNLLRCYYGDEGAAFLSCYNSDMDGFNGYVRQVVPSSEDLPDGCTYAPLYAQ